MTKEELDIQKEIGNYFTESTGFGRDKIKNFIDIVNKALKQKGERIAELEQENNKLLDVINNQDVKIADLEKENAELDMKRKAERKIFQGIVEKKNDQLDVNKGYCPENCRWVSQKVQQNNKRNNRLVTYKGKTQTLSEWCDELHLNYKTVSTRINNYHWSVERAFEESIGNVPDMATFQGRTQSIKGWCKELNISVFTVRTRLRSGWSIEKALGTRPRQKVK